MIWRTLSGFGRTMRTNTRTAQRLARCFIEFAAGGLGCCYLGNDVSSITTTRSKGLEADRSGFPRSAVEQWRNNSHDLDTL
jgi:hypothetical protein